MPTHPAHLLSAKATRNPRTVIKPAKLWATSNASGIIVSTSMARIAPAATAVVAATTAAENRPNTAYPASEASRVSRRSSVATGPSAMQDFGWGYAICMGVQRRVPEADRESRCEFRHRYLCSKCLGKLSPFFNGRKRQYYIWDHTHNDIEVFDAEGVHLGTIDPRTGLPIKPAVKGRYLDEIK